VCLPQIGLEFLVLDEQTLDWFTKTAGYTWTDIVTVDQEGVTPAGELTIPMKMVYSGNEPRLELLQTVADTVWTPADSGVHHIGYWSDDVESDLATLESDSSPRFRRRASHRTPFFISGGRTVSATSPSE
jgi:Glyoxalase/Bleomycin resistance protein/Dioxygenase superfamily